MWLQDIIYMEKATMERPDKKQRLSVEASEEFEDSVGAGALAPHNVVPPNPENTATASIAQKELQRLGYYDNSRTARTSTCFEPALSCRFC